MCVARRKGGGLKIRSAHRDLTYVKQGERGVDLK